MKKIILILITLVILIISGCSNNSNNNIDAKPVIVTTFYPVEEITKIIVTDTINVKVLIPIGSEPHSFEPTPKQIVELSKANLFITMDGMFEHIEESIIDSNPNLKIIQATKNINLIENQEEPGNGFDPHVWLSIKNMIEMTKTIEMELINMYPNNKKLYELNANNYIKKLKNLDNIFKRQLSNCSQTKIIVNHKAFGYLGNDYNFKQISIGGFIPEVEPTPKAIINLIDSAKEMNLKYIFSEGQMDKKTINTISEEIGVEVLELNPIKRFENETYISIQENNLANLVKGLECK